MHPERYGLLLNSEIGKKSEVQKRSSMCDSKIVWRVDSLFYFFGLNIYHNAFEILNSQYTETLDVNP